MTRRRGRLQLNLDVSLAVLGRIGHELADNESKIAAERCGQFQVHTLGDEGRWREVRLYQGDVRVRAAPFEAIELDLAALWSPPVVR